MNFNEFREYTVEAFANNPTAPAPQDEQIEKLYLLTNRMLQVNQKMNLTAIKDEKAIILKHYVDSLLVSPYISENLSVIDIGCGAGFPTLPLAILRPDLSILALDSTAKRIEYVKETAKLLDLSNVSAISARAEELAASNVYREKFDTATARAVASLPILTELCLPFVKVGGKFIAMKAQKADSEIESSAGAIRKCGGSLGSSESIKLDIGDGDFELRTIVVIPKTKATPKEYPRHYSKISKKPL